MNATGITKATTININVEGGKLGVSFKKDSNQFTNVF
jgi:diaminopimelate epimerase